MKVERLDHVHIYVKDLEKAAKFFGDLLESRVSDPPMTETKDHQIKSVLLPLGIELISSLTPDGPVGKAIEKGGEGLKAISLKVPNIDEAIEEMKSLGIRQVGRVKVGKLQEAQFHPRDTFGVMIELCEHDLDHPAYIAFYANEEEI